MKTKLQIAIEMLRDATRQLRRVERLPVVPPKLGRYYETLNGSIVYVCKEDSDGGAVAVVLKGGHGLRYASGEEPGERYHVGRTGYGARRPGPELMMSLSREIDPPPWKGPERAISRAFEGSIWAEGVVDENDTTRAARGLEEVVHMDSLVTDLRTRRNAKVWS